MILEAGSLTEEYKADYGKAVAIGKRWCLMTEAINKINWFLSIRTRIKQYLAK